MTSIQTFASSLTVIPQVVFMEIFARNTNLFDPPIVDGRETKKKTKSLIFFFFFFFVQTPRCPRLTFENVLSIILS